MQTEVLPGAMKKIFVLLNIILLPALLSGQDGNTRQSGSPDTGNYKPTVVILSLDEMNTTQAYSAIFQKVASLQTVKLMTTGPVFEKLRELLPKDREKKSLYEISHFLGNYAYRHFIDEIILIRNGKPEDKFMIDLGVLHVDDNPHYVQFDEYRVEEKYFDYILKYSIPNMIKNGNWGLGENKPDILKYPGHFIFTNMKTGKPVDLSSCKGNLIVLTHYPVSGLSTGIGFDNGSYDRLKDIFAKLNQRYPGVITIFGVIDSSANGKKYKCMEEMKKPGVLSDPDFPYPIVNVTALPNYDRQPFMTLYYGECSEDGITNRQFDVWNHDRFVFSMIDSILTPEKRALVRTTLVEAARNNNPSEVRRLMKEGADPLLTEDSHFALDWAVYHDNHAMIDEITGARKPTNDFFNACLLAIDNGKYRIFETLIHKINVSADNISDLWKIKALYSSAEKAGNRQMLAVFEKNFPSVILFLRSDFTFDKLIASGIKPGIAPDFPFPVSAQPGKAHTCELFAMKHVLKYKYNEDLNIPSWEKIMGKNPHDLWFFSECAKVADKAGMEFEYYDIEKADIGLFFYYLTKGEPVITERELGPDKHRHSVVAYSYDAKGVWLSDSANGTRWQIPVEKLTGFRCFTMRVIKKKTPGKK